MMYIHSVMRDGYLGFLKQNSEELDDEIIIKEEPFEKDFEIKEDPDSKKQNDFVAETSALLEKDLQIKVKTKYGNKLHLCEPNDCQRKEQLFEMAEKDVRKHEVSSLSTRDDKRHMRMSLDDLTEKEKCCRRREQNNVACREYRSRKKTSVFTAKHQLLELSTENRRLKERVKKLECQYKQYLKLRKDLEGLGYKFPELNKIRLL